MSITINESALAVGPLLKPTPSDLEVMPSEMAVAIFFPGSMGSSMAWAIKQRSPDAQILTCVEGRSAATVKRAQDNGMVPSSMEEIVSKSRVIISILPPSESVKLAQEVIQLWSFVSSSAAGSSATPSRPPIYVDANAISPSTVNSLAALFSEAGIPFIDGSVIGGPSRQGYDPRVYLCSSPSDESALEEVWQMLGDGKGLNLVPMKGAGIGAASALKMSYAGMTKGTTGLATAMVLSASKHSPATARAFIDELQYSQPGILSRAAGTLESMLPKAYRWVGEMEEIADYISNPTGQASTSITSTLNDTLSNIIPSALQLPTGLDPDQNATARKSDIADIYRGIAKAFEAVAADLEKGGEGDVKLLKDFVEKAKRAGEGGGK